ncbi:MAG: exo-alpha-sialidase, partial [Alphaproteobacteria bacterium]|nr:exo-alpha-sialidase [Alphaproteobacteria bacterium]
YSDDWGVTWKNLQNNRPVTSEAMFTIGGGNSLFYVPCPDNTTTYVSYDNGQTWAPSGFTGSSYNLYYEPFIYSFDAANNARYFAITAHAGTLKASADGITWNTLSPNVAYGDNTQYEGGTFYVNGYWYIRDYKANVLKRSRDCITWSDVSWNINPGKRTCFCYGSNLLMGTTEANDNENLRGTIYTSTDLCNFASHSKLTVSQTGNYRYNDICYANGNFILNTINGNTSYTSYHDGVIWLSDNTQVISQDIDQPKSLSKTISGSGSCTFDTTNMTITDIRAEYILPPVQSKRIEFKKLRQPEMSASVDFSQSVNGKPVYNQNLVIFGRTEGQNLNPNTFYDESFANWCFTGENNNFYNKSGLYQYHYVTFEDVSNNASKMEIWYGINRSKDCRLTSYFPGIFRIYFSPEQTIPSTGFRSYGKHLLLSGGFTLPINAMLYAGYYDSAYHKGAWYKDQSGNASYEATDAVKNVTKAACTKLKAVANTRIYLIKYRKQAQYKHKITGTATNFDYSYLNDCASDTGSTTKIATTQEDAGKFRFDISSEADLNTALSAIAANIKDWAGYKRAENK